MGFADGDVPFVIVGVPIAIAYEVETMSSEVEGLLLKLSKSLRRL